MRSSLCLSSSILKSTTNLLKVSTGVPNTAPGIQSTTAEHQHATNMSTSTTSAVSKGDLGVESIDYSTATGVNLSEKQKVIVGSVLDLFSGKVTLKKLSLWTEDATFNDPLTKSAGRRQYSAQWYGLAAAFSEIERQSCKVKDAGNPITIDLKTRYKVKGLGTEKIIESVVKIFTDAQGDKITGVEDRWNGNIPEGAIAKVFRNLNAATVPVFVSVPKSEQEEAAKK